MMDRKDTEAISAYLDGQLARRDRERLQARLDREPALRAELEALDRTRGLLRSAPHFRAPRNFTLTPEMAGIAAEKPGILFAVSRLSFTLTTILFVVALIGNFSFQGLGGSQSAETTAFSTEADSAMAPLEEAPSAAEDAAGAAPAPGEDGGAADSQSIESMQAVEEESVESGDDPAEIEAVGPPTEEPLSIAEEAAPPAEDPVAEGAITVTPSEAEGTRKVPATEEPLEPEIASVPADEDRIAAAADPEPINPWSIFTVLAGIAALLSGGLTLALRKR